MPDFRRLWIGGLFGNLGEEIGTLAIPVLALVTIGASAQELSYVRVALYLPFIIFTVWLGAVVDRRRRRPLMVFASVSRAVVLVVIGALAVLGSLEVWMLIVGALLLGVMEVLFTLADFSILPLILSEKQLADGNGKMTASQSAVNIGGSGVGGALVQFLTAPVAILVNAFCHLVSAVFVWRVDVAEADSDVVSSEESSLKFAFAGVRQMIHNGALLGLALEAALWNLGNEIFTLAVTVLIVDKLNNGALVLGIVLMCGGFGAFIGSLLSARLTSKFGYGKSLIACLLIGNTAPLFGAFLLDSLSLGNIILLGVAYLASGLGMGVANSQAVTVRQLLSAPSERGRVNAAYRLLSWGALSVGALTAGVAVSSVGGPGAGILGASVMAIATLPVLCSPVRKMDTLSGR